MYALAESAGAITNFDLLSWTQPVMFKLINPLLGNNCSIGTIGNPVVLNPALTVGPGGELTITNDPNPAKHPDTFVLGITQAVGRRHHLLGARRQRLRPGWRGQHPG